ncbi:EpsG family protein [Chryseobacterium sp. Mn2064]|uniref:EpsG family protein n=1 Tax=Chryseobacterium sp. Mn2064 TaxID=3395263 RepID=UPI003BEA9D37
MYTPVAFSIVFYLFASLLVMAVVADSYTKKRLLNINENTARYFYLIPLLLIILIGSRPVGEGGFIDSPMYKDFFRIADTYKVSPMKDKDLIFGYFILLTSYFTNYRGFFVICGAISVVLAVLVSRSVSKKYWILFFIGHIASLYYWNYNVFGLRQGLASALFLYALFVKNKWWRAILMIMSFGTHFSLGLPILGYIITIFIGKVDKRMYGIWGLLIPISYFFGIKIEYTIAKLIPDIRTNYFIENIGEQVFRWDIIAYSFVILAISYYFIFVKKIKDVTYHRIVNVFIFANTALLLLIRVNHAHRFAYLSWFLGSLVVFYPFFISDADGLKNKYKVFSQTVLAFFTFVVIHFIKITFF